MASKQIVAQSLEKLFDAKPGASAPDDANRQQVLTAYHLALLDIPDVVVLQATVIAIRRGNRTYNRIHSADELYRICTDLMDDSPDDAEAWRLVLRLARGVPLELPAPVQHALDQIGGVEGWTEDNLGIHRAQFVKAYHAERERIQQQAALPSDQALALLGAGR